MKRPLFLLFLLLSPHALACVDPTVAPPLTIDSAYPNPLEGGEEWIALYNPNNQTVDLSLYTLEDGTGHPWTLTGNINAKSRLEISGFPFQLNNGEDTVILRRSDGTQLDELSYTSTQAGVAIGAVETSSTLTEEDTVTTPSDLPEFSEALPDPEGSDTTEEWIELYNPNEHSIQLDGLLLDDQAGGSKPYALSGSIPAKAYKVLPITESKLTLNNSTDSVRLLDTEEKVLWEVPYEDSEEAMSYAKIGDHYEWTSLPTPEAPNQSSEVSQDNLNGDLSEDIEITEVFPNPEGADQNEEWIEITNGGEEIVNLGNWTLDDGPDGSEAYIFPDETMIEPGQTIVIYREDSHLALNNSSERVILNDFVGELMDELQYDTSEEGMSYAKIHIQELKNEQASLSDLGQRISSIWEWVLPSPGSANPSWKEIKGTVEAFDGQVLTLNDGISNWQLQVNTSKFDAILFQNGNELLVRVSLEDGIYTVEESNLIQAAAGESKKTFPLNLFGIASFAIGWVGYEFFKKIRGKQSQIPLQVS